MYKKKNINRENDVTITNLYQLSDIDLLLKNWNSIMEDVEKQKLINSEPTLEEMKEVHEIVLEFVRVNNRKMYGGYALNTLIKNINPDDAIYKTDKVPDVDFYSPDPIVDLMKLCNILQKKGYKYIIGREALHKETYSISVNYVLYCDISYVPKNIYNRMPYKDIDGYKVIHPHFMIIDYLRMMSDPMTSYWRFDGDLKSFRRFYLLQKYFPLPTNTNPINITGSTADIEKMLNIVLTYIINKKTLLMTGFYAYDYMLNSSEILKDTKYKYFKLLNVPYYECISTNYVSDCLDLIALLKESNKMSPDDISHVEFYPFFQFTGHSVEIYYKNTIIARIYNNNKKCIPYKSENALLFNKLTVTKMDGTVRLGTFPVVLLYSLITIMKARTNNDTSEKDLYYTLSSHLIEMRNYYFKKNNKSFLDNTIFQEFIPYCAGESIDPQRERRLMIDHRKKNNKRAVFVYEPSSDLREPESNYVFANSSGNKINNPKNLKLEIKNITEDIELDNDEDSENS